MMRSAVLVCGMCIAAGGTLVAQDQAPPPPPQTQGQGGARGMMDPGQRAQMLKDRLGLNDSQTSQIKAIYADGTTKMQALRSNSSLSQDDRRSQMMSMRKDENDKIEALLTADQKTKFEAMQQEMRGRRGGGGGGGQQ